MNNNKHHPKSSRRIIYYVYLLLLIGHGHGYSQLQPYTESDDTLSYFLPNVVVTAIESKAPGSTSLLPASAIEHVQPISAADLMQLLPGGLTGNSGFNTPQYFTVREATFANGGNRTSANIAEGMQIIVDGSPLHHNAHINSPYTGVDTRFLSMNEVERVEVMRGIPSVQYGNLTNGVLLMKTRTGEMPLTLGIRYNPNLKQYTAGKGFSISPTGHTLNLLADYTTQQDFHIGGLRLANTYHWLPGGNPFLLNLSYTMRTGGEKKYISDENHSRMKRQEHRFTLGAEWKPGRHLLQQISFRVDLSANKSSLYEYGVSYTNSSATDALISGDAPGFALPNRYITPTQTDDLPLYAEAEVLASTHLPMPRTNGQAELKAGLTWRSEGNKGEGVQFDVLLPPGNSMRPRSYRDIPFLHSSALFAEALFRWSRLTLQTGLRYQALMSDGYTAGNVEPRVNLTYTAFSSPNYQLRLKAGAGLMSYMPTADRLYPSPIYNDQLVFYYADEETDYSMHVYNVHVQDKYRNNHLRPTVNRKAEAGFMLETPAVRLDMTGFYERQTGGFSTATDYIPHTFRDYESLWNDGLRPELHDGQVWVDGAPVEYEKRTRFIKVTTPVNATRTHKYGIEMTADFGTFQPLCTSLIVDGIWLRICRRNSFLNGENPFYETIADPYPYIGYYDVNTGSIGNEQTSEQLSTNFRFITRIPRIGLVTSFTLQMVWMTKDRTTYNGGSYETLWPLYWAGTDGIRHPFTDAEKENSDFSELEIIPRKDKFEQNTYKPYGLINFRASKEFTRYVTLSFFVNNLADMRPSRMQASSSMYIRQNPGSFFGLELQIKL